MSELVETIHGRYSKWTVYREAGGLFSSTKFYVYKDGKYVYSCSTLKYAVQRIKDKDG
jgi:hypothetical protein